MELRWRDAEIVELRSGYSLADATGQPVTVIEHARIACEGGFLHIAITGTADIQLISAPALARAVYRD